MWRWAFSKKFATVRFEHSGRAAQTHTALKKGAARLWTSINANHGSRRSTRSASARIHPCVNERNESDHWRRRRRRRLQAPGRLARVFAFRFMAD